MFIILITIVASLVMALALYGHERRRVYIETVMMPGTRSSSKLVEHVWYFEKENTFVIMTNSEHYRTKYDIKYSKTSCVGVEYLGVL